MIIYIAGKVSGIEMEARVLFKTAEIKLLLQGHDVINPMELEHDHDKTWQSYMRECISAMMKADALYLLPNWRESKGARIEVQLAHNLGIKIFFNLKEIKQIKHGKS